MKRENKGEELTLANKISKHGHILFALRPDGNGFYPGHDTQQRSALENFCSREDKTTAIGTELSQKICG